MRDIRVGIVMADCISLGFYFGLCRLIGTQLDFLGLQGKFFPNHNPTFGVNGNSQQGRSSVGRASDSGRKGPRFNRAAELEKNL